MSELWTPTSNSFVKSDEPVVFPPEYMKMIAAFALTSPKSQIWVHCRKCGHNIEARTATEDNHWAMHCGCRNYIGMNPLRGN